MMKEPTTLFPWLFDNWVLTALTILSLVFLLAPGAIAFGAYWLGYLRRPTVDRLPDENDVIEEVTIVEEPRRAA